ncbi:MAG: lipoyl(octanoyl) transferase LipB [Pseudomonadota bacterium]
MQLIVRKLGLQTYLPIWERMKLFTDSRTPDTPDEIWLCQHFPVFTQGQAGKQEHILNPGDIPVIPVDRGGQITYHGPGQLMMYTLLDVKRARLGVRKLVNALEKSIVDTLEKYGTSAYAKADAPGVYVNEKKICSVGLRIRRGASFHGLAFNVDMDLAPFQRINPCGYEGLEMVDCTSVAGPTDIETAQEEVVQAFCSILDLNVTECRESLDE